MLTYAGITLALPDPETYLWILRSLNPADAPDFQRRTWPGRNLTGIAWPGQTPPRPPKLNTLYWPTGASRWAVFCGLANDADVQALRRACLYGGQVKAQDLVIAQNAPDGTIPDAGKDQASVTTKMWMLPPRPLMQCPGPINGVVNAPATSPYSDRLWLITLVDDRYWWWQKSMTDLVVTENTTTWNDLFTKIGTALGQGVALDPGVAVDPIPAAYLKPAAAWEKNYEALPLLLDAACYNVGMRFVRARDGFLQAQAPATSLAAVADLLAQTDRLKVWGGGIMALEAAQASNDLAFLMPGKVRVAFCADPAAEPCTIDIELASLKLPQFTNVSGNQQTFKVFKDVALADAPTIPTNFAELSALATQIAKDWYLYQLAKVDVKLDGIDPWCNDGLCDAIEWTYLPWDVSTRIYRPPFNDQVEELQHASSLGACANKAGAVASKTAAVLVEFEDHLLCAPFAFVDGTPQLFDPDVAGTIEVSSASWSGGIVTFNLAGPHGLSTGAASATIGNTGAGYVNGDVLTPTGGTFTAAATFKVLAVNGIGGVLTVQVQNSGVYTVTPANPAATTGGTGTGCTLTISYGLSVVSATVAAGGIGYTNGDALTLIGGDFSTAANFVATVAAGVVIAVTLNSGGNYTRQAPNPASTSGGTGSGCTLNATYTGGAPKFRIIEAVPDTYNGVFTASQLTSSTTVKALMSTDPGAYQFNADFINISNGLYVAKPPLLQVDYLDGQLVLFPNGVYHFYEYQWRVEDAVIQAGGSSYAVDDSLTTVGGTISGIGQAARFRVVAVDGGGAVTSIATATPGVYEVTPTNPVATTTDSVSGSGCTLRLFRSRQRTNTEVVPELDSSGNPILDGSGNNLFTSKQASLTEVIDPAYFTGDIILLDGGPTGLTDENNATISWTDANNGGRHWKALIDEPILAILTDKDLTRSGFRRYAWTQVIDSDHVSPPTSAIGASVSNGGRGYHVGDTLPAIGGVFSTAATFIVLAVDSGGAVLIVNLGTVGSYTVPPTNPVSTSGGAGSGCTLDVVFGGDPITYTSGDLSGTFDDNPAYNINDIDIAVPFFAWLTKSKAGNYYLFDGEAQWEVCIQTGASPSTIAGIQYFPGKMGVYDQNAKEYIDGEDVWLLDANA